MAIITSYKITDIIIIAISKVYYYRRAVVTVTANRLETASTIREESWSFSSPLSKRNWRR